MFTIQYTKYDVVSSCDGNVIAATNKTHYPALKVRFSGVG